MQTTAWQILAEKKAKPEISESLNLWKFPVFISVDISEQVGPPLFKNYYSGIFSE